MNYIAINQENLEFLISSNEILQEALETISSQTGQTYYDDRGDYLSIIKRWPLFHVSTIEQIEKLLEENKREYLRFCTIMVKNIIYVLDKSIVLFYLQHFLAAKSQDQNYIINYIDFAQPIIMHDMLPEEYIQRYNLAASDNKI